MAPKRQPKPRSPRRGPVRRAAAPVLEFLSTEAGGGAVLLAATIVALVWANSPWQGAYDRLWSRDLTLGIGDWSSTTDLRHWVNEGLMTFFFFVVGLEIKRELVAGELASVRRALLPVVAAAGGMLLPALLYLSVNAGGPGGGGWGVPMATDIAFALGALSLFGGVSPSARVFLLSLAIVDDVGAIVLIAAFYSDGVSWTPLLAATGLVVTIAILRRAGLRWMTVYGLLGALLWVATRGSGVHPTIAGVVLALMVPARRDKVDAASLPPATDRLIHRLHPWTSYAIVPLFALANAGVELSRTALSGAFSSRVAIGIVVGLVAGKLLGIGGATWLAVRLGLRPPPEDGWRTTAGVAATAGIGFTVSLFVADLAFTDPTVVAEAKIGILAGSMLAAILGSILLRAGPRSRRRAPRSEDA